MNRRRRRGWAAEEGTPAPLGVTWIETEQAYNFALYSKHAEGVTLLLYRDDDLATPALTHHLDHLTHKSGRVWHCRIPRRRMKGARYYAYRVAGPAPAGRYERHAFDPDKVLLDPYARSVFFPPGFDRRAALGAGSNAGKAPLGFIPACEPTFDWRGDRRPRHEWDTVLYELHVKGFTMHPASGVSPEARGTYAGVIEKIPYLRELGVTAVELMPVFQYDPQEGNYWGYMPLGFFAPHHAYATAPAACACEQHNEFRAMVRALHAAGIEVILDVVYNHTAEGDHTGPRYSYKGIDNSTYYLVSDRPGAPYENFSGTGNTLHCANHYVRKMILDSLRYWVDEMHVDGFRFDLASIFTRRADGTIDLEDPAIFGDIVADPHLAGVRLIAEPWDAAGAYHLGRDFPGITWLQWNGRFRDEIRRVVRGDAGLVGALMTRLYGSDDLFPGDRLNAYHAYQSVNYVTSHDGFTLYDLLAYDEKRNWANGHGNADGPGENYSWNCGWEGDEGVPAEVLRLRKRQAKNLCCLLFLSNGTPMLRAGDEFLQTQGGNSNPYNQDSATTWLDWDRLAAHRDVFRFFTRMIAFRKAHRTLGRSRFWRDDVRWYGVDRAVDLTHHSRSLAFCLDGASQEDVDLYVMINAYWEDLVFTVQEGAAGLDRHGPNQLEEAPPPSAWGTLVHQFTSPLIYILLLATLVTLLLQEYADATVIAAVLALNAVIGFAQERRAERSVRALMHLVAPRARVIREGREWDVESRELVPGDVVLLESGARVPADLRLASATALLVDESLFTGESVPVVKGTAPLDREDLVVGDRTNMAYAGTVVASGRGRGYVVATGGASELGAIARHVRTETRAATPLQHRMTRFARVVSIVVATSAVTAFALGVARGESPADMFIVAVALAVSAIPEGLPVAFTITLALGVRRMARRSAIIRRLPAVETLGSTTVIGSDKTGTLTENRMTLQKVWAGGRTFTVSDAGRREAAAVLDGGQTVRLADDQPLALTLLAGILASEGDVSLTEEGYETRGDPTEAALLVGAARLGLEPAEARARYPVYAEIPFEPERQYSASIRAREDGHVVFVKGAPERVLGMCTRLLAAEGPVPLDRAAVLEAARALAAEGLRVLGMASGTSPGPPRPDRIEEPGGLTFLGLQGSMDPPRRGVREAIAGCQASGIRVVMITGDHAGTARAIGAELGIAPREAPVLTGAELGAMDDAALRAQVPQVAVYARVAPEHKLRVVQALQSHGEVVAVTGDGVNDAPALKAAEIGVAMGKSGTDVAREASDMVLADDNFVSIYAAVEEGRVTFDNLRKVTFFLISTGAAEVVAILTTLLLQWPLPFLPAQILWLNLVTNGLQDVALAFEPGEPGVLRRPPRRRGEGIVSRLLWERTLVAGLVMAAGTLLLFWWELQASADLGRAQTVALTTMVLYQVFHVGNCRSEGRSVFALSPWSNPFLFVATAAAVLVHVAALYLPPMQLLLRVEPLDLDAWVRMGVVASTILAAMEAHKLLRGRRARPG